MILPWIFKEYPRSRERFPNHVCHLPSSDFLGWSVKRGSKGKT